MLMFRQQKIFGQIPPAFQIKLSLFVAFDVQIFSRMPHFVADIRAQIFTHSTNSLF